MNDERSFERTARAWLEQGANQAPDRAIQSVLLAIETTPQERDLRIPWRFPQMNKLVAIGLGTAAVVVALFVGAQLLGPPAPGGVGAAPSPTAAPTTAPSPTPEPSVAAPSPPDGSLPEGPFVLSSATSPLPSGIASTVTIAAPGWSGDPSGGVLFKDTAGMIGPWHEPLYVYGDPCRWSTTTPTTPATTVDAIVAALASQASRDASAPVDVTLDGYPGKKITLHVPKVFDVPEEGTFTDCDEGKFGSWGSNSEPGPARYHQLPGQIDEVWIVDVDGQAAVIDGSYYAETPAETVAEMRRIINSVDFQP